MSTITITIDDADVQPDDTVGSADVRLTDELHEAVARRLEEGLGIDIGEVDVRVDDGEPSPIARSPDVLVAKIDELQAYSGYPENEHAAAYRRHKHGGWVEALRWALGADRCERPMR